MLQGVVDIGITIFKTTNGMILIHERSSLGRLFGHVPEALNQSALYQLERIFESVPEAFKVGDFSFTESDTMFDAQLGQNDGDRHVVTATDSGITEAVAIVADQGSTQADGGFPSGYRLRLSLEHCCSPALCHREFHPTATLLACLHMQCFR